MAPGPGVFMARASRRRRAGGASGRAVPLSGLGAPARGFRVTIMGGLISACEPEVRHSDCAVVPVPAPAGPPRA